MDWIEARRNMSQAAVVAAQAEYELARLKYFAEIEGVDHGQVIQEPATKNERRSKGEYHLINMQHGQEAAGPGG